MRANCSRDSLNESMENERYAVTGRLDGSRYIGRIGPLWNTREGAEGHLAALRGKLYAQGLVDQAGLKVRVFRWDDETAKWECDYSS